MSRSLNVVHLIGYVGADPELRRTTGGTDVANLSLATTRQWNDDAGRKQEKTEWHRLTVWGALAGVVDKYVRKGDRLYVSGRVEYRTWTDADNAARFSTDIHVQELLMLGSPGGRDNARSQGRPRDDERPRAQGRDQGADEDRDDYADDGGDGGPDGYEGEYEGGDDDYVPRQDARPRGGKRTDRQNRPASRPKPSQRRATKQGRK